MPVLCVGPVILTIVMFIDFLNIEDVVSIITSLTLYLYCNTRVIAD